MATKKRKVKGKSKGRAANRAGARRKPVLHKAKSAASSATKVCEVPDVPPREFSRDVGPERAELIRNSDRKWANGTKLHYHFLASPAAWAGSTLDKRRARDGFQAWKNVGIGLDFKEVASPDDAEIRIAFERNGGHWSYVGRDILTVAQSDRTMNLDKGDTWDVDTATHEIGHTLGFQHEHQNPDAGIVWNEEAVYADLGGPPNNWSREKTERNIIRKLSPGDVRGSAWDKNSIMHYAFKAGLIDLPAVYRNRPLQPLPGLSPVDKREVKTFYPPLARNDHRTLRPFQFVRLSLKPAKQANFVIRPSATRRYQINTFGQSDTVMVLFEEIDGVARYSAADDDSGYDRNARITTRLFSGRTYYLRVRMYYQHRQGDFGVMMW